MRGKTFERKILERISGLQTGKWKIRYNTKYQNLFQRPYKMREIAKRTLTWVEHARQNNDTVINTVIKEDLHRKRLLQVPRLK